MDVKEAVRTAKDYLAELYIDEEVEISALKRYDSTTTRISGS